METLSEPLVPHDVDALAIQIASDPVRREWLLNGPPKPTPVRWWGYFSPKRYTGMELLNYVLWLALIATALWFATAQIETLQRQLSKPDIISSIEVTDTLQLPDTLICNLCTSLNVGLYGVQYNGKASRNESLYKFTTVGVRRCIIIHSSEFWLRQGTNEGTLDIVIELFIYKYPETCSVPGMIVTFLSGDEITTQENSMISPPGFVPVGLEKTTTKRIDGDVNVDFHPTATPIPFYDPDAPFQTILQLGFNSFVVQKHTEMYTGNTVLAIGSFVGFIGLLHSIKTIILYFVRKTLIRMAQRRDDKQLLLKNEESEL